MVVKSCNCIFMYGRMDLLRAPNISIYILNSFVMTITALAIAYFMGMLIKRQI